MPDVAVINVHLLTHDIGNTEAAERAAAGSDDMGEGQVETPVKAAAKPRSVFFHAR